MRDVRDVDLGVIFGLGFPPFRGGLLFWADTLGAAKIVELLKPFESLGPRLRPDAAAVGNGRQRQEVLRPDQNQTALGRVDAADSPHRSPPPAPKYAYQIKDTCRVKTCRDCRLSANSHRSGPQRKGRLPRRPQRRSGRRRRPGADRAHAASIRPKSKTSCWATPSSKASRASMSPGPSP